MEKTRGTNLPGLALGDITLHLSSLRHFPIPEACLEHAKGLFHADPFWGFPKYFKDLEKKQPHTLEPAAAAQLCVQSWLRPREPSWAQADQGGAGRWAAWVFAT